MSRECNVLNYQHCRLANIFYANMMLGWDVYMCVYALCCLMWFQKRTKDKREKCSKVKNLRWKETDNGERLVSEPNEQRTKERIHEAYLYFCVTFCVYHAYVRMCCTLAGLFRQSRTREGSYMRNLKMRCQAKFSFWQKKRRIPSSVCVHGLNLFISRKCDFPFSSRPMNVLSQKE